MRLIRKICSWKGQDKEMGWGKQKEEKKANGNEWGEVKDKRNGVKGSEKGK